jgi:tetratricopeptide (TPR) repeat protein
MGCDVAYNPPARPRATLPIVTSRARPSLRSSASLTRCQSIISACTAYLAAAQEREGAIVDALETVEQALEANPHELVSRPEILRLRGELRLKQGDTELAEADFRNSVALARTMGAKAWELRTTTSLARLLAKQGRWQEARAMLTEIYNWFTEGFDTADLKDARMLLEELAT